MVLKGKKGLLFDLDGVITDTAEYHYQAWKKLADSLQIHFDKQMNEELKGLSRMDSLEKLLGSRSSFFSRGEKELLTKKKNDEYRLLLEKLSRADILPSIEELLIELKERQIPVGLASASKNAPFVLEKLELADYFSIIVDPNAVPYGKPAPDMYLKGAELLGLPPQACIGIEDAASGVRAIKSAHMVAIGIGDNDTLTAAGADIILSDTSQLTWELLSTLL